MIIYFKQDKITIIITETMKVLNRDLNNNYKMTMMEIIIVN